MVESIEDRKGGSCNILSGPKKNMWTKLKRKLWLEDSITYKTDQLRFSCDSKKKHRHDPNNQNRPIRGKRVLKRLDRVYSPIAPSSTHLHIKSSILLGFAFSDHAPVLAKVRALGRIVRPTMYRMNSKQLKDPMLVTKLEDLWKDLKEQVLADVTNAPAIFFKGLYLS